MSLPPSTSRSGPPEPLLQGAPAAGLDLGASATYAFDLPEALIATTPAERRDESRLLALPAAGPLAHHRFGALAGLLRPGDLLVRNAARVLPARLLGRKPTGGQVELLVLGPLGATWDAPGPARFRALGRASKGLPAGTRVQIGPGVWIAVLARGDGGEVEAVAESVASLAELLEAHGHVPLPPYIRRARAQRGQAVPPALDRERYQTVYARTPGAVAAPTAGLHVTAAVLAGLAERGVEVADLELDVGVGTFRPIEVARLDDVSLHTEAYRLPTETAARINAARLVGRRIVALGTTAFRALEDQAARGPCAVAGAFETRLFVRPGSPIRWVDALVTNFHLPRSSLLVLVCALAGCERVRAAYAEAVAAGYRFYSYGDAMLVERCTPA